MGSLPSLPLFYVLEHWPEAIRQNVQEEQGGFARKEMRDLTFILFGRC